MRNRRSEEYCTVFSPTAYLELTTENPIDQAVRNWQADIRVVPLRAPHPRFPPTRPDISLGERAVRIRKQNAVTEPAIVDCRGKALCEERGGSLGGVVRPRTRGFRDWRWCFRHGCRSRARAGGCYRPQGCVCPLCGERRVRAPHDGRI
jgi:hypothetical protein